MSKIDVMCGILLTAFLLYVAICCYQVSMPGDLAVWNIFRLVEVLR